MQTEEEKPKPVPPPKPKAVMMSREVQAEVYSISEETMTDHGRFDVDQAVQSVSAEFVCVTFPAETVLAFNLTHKGDEEVRIRGGDSD